MTDIVIPPSAMTDREVDVAIAVKFFGFTPVDNHDGEFYAPGMGHMIFSSRDDVRGLLIPFYSRNMHEAWQVVKAVGAASVGEKHHPAHDGRVALYKAIVRIEYWDHEGECRVTIGRCKSVGCMDDDVDVCRFVEYGQDEDCVMARTICEAALIAVGDGSAK